MLLAPVGYVSRTTELVCWIRICISHQPYHSIWISCTNHCVWVLFSCKWCHGIRGLALCAKNYINQKFGPHLISVMVNGLRKSHVEMFWDMKRSHWTFCIIFRLKRVFLPLCSQRTRQTTYIPSRTMKTTSKVPIRRYPITALHEH